MPTEQLLVRLQMDAGQYKREAREASTATTNVGKAADGATLNVRKFGKEALLGAASAGGLALGAAAAAAGVINFGKETVTAATSLNESINAVNVVFGDAADGVLAIGENAATSFGLAQSEFNGFAVQFSNFATTIAEQEGRDVAEVIEEMTGRIADFASVMNIDVPQAAEKFRSGLAGETEPLRQFGIDVSAAAVNQKALELNLANTTAELTEQDKVLARYELIMEQTDKVAGDFKNTQGDLANATRTFSALLEDFKAQLGESIIPFLGDFVLQLTNILRILDDNPEVNFFEKYTASAALITGQSPEVVKAILDQAEAVFLLNEENAKAVAVTEESIGASNRHRGSRHAEADAIDEVTEAFEGTELAVQNAADALEAYDDAFRRLTDPIFRHLDDQRNLQTAYEDYEAVLKDAEATTKDQETALFDLLAAQQEVNSSGAQLPETMGRSEAAFEQLASQLGLTEDQARQMRDVLESIDGQTYRADITAFFKVGGNQNAFDAIVNGQATRRGDVVFRAAGGPLDAYQPAIVGERGPELFIPSRAGTIIPNHAMSGGSPAGTTVNAFVLSWDDFKRQAHKAGIDISRLGWN